MLFLINFGTLISLANPQAIPVDKLARPAFPYFPVSIQNEGGEHRCIGNIVHRRYVLTTCRCTSVANGTNLRPLDQNLPREKIVLLHREHRSKSKYQSLVTTEVKLAFIHPRCERQDAFYLNDEGVLWTSTEIRHVQDHDILEFYPIKVGIGNNIMFLAWNTSKVLVSNFLAASVVIVANRTNRENCVKIVCKHRMNWKKCESILPAMSCLQTTDDVCNLNFEGSAVFHKYGDLYYAEGLMPYTLYSDRSCRKGYHGTILFTPLVDGDNFIYNVVTGRIQSMIQPNSMDDQACRFVMARKKTTLLIILTEILIVVLNSNKYYFL